MRPIPGTVTDPAMDAPREEPKELHVIVQVPELTDPWRFAESVKNLVLEFQGPVEIQYHLHEHRTTGGQIIGWNVIETRSFETHTAARDYAELVERFFPATDVELEAVYAEAVTT